MSDDGGVGSRTSGVGALVSDSGLDVADGGTLSDPVDGEHVSGGDGGLPAGEDVLSGVASLSSNEVLDLFFIFVGISELDLSKGAPSSWVVSDGSNNTSQVSLTFCEIEVTIVGGSDSMLLSFVVNTRFFTFSLAYIKICSYT